MQERKLLGMATDPIYIGTGGYTIGRVDNTIVRDAVTRIPKIPGTSIAGTWRYYMALKLHEYFKDEKYRKDRKERKGMGQDQLFEDNSPEWVRLDDNRFTGLVCAGQDEAPNAPTMNKVEHVKGHCGRCIVCKTFGYSKKNESKQGQAFFSDMQVLLFPVYTRCGVRWITSPMMLEQAGIRITKKGEWNWDEVVVLNTDSQNDSYINLGWMNLKIANQGKSWTEIINSEALDEKLFSDDSYREILPSSITDDKKIILVSDDLVSQVINANLEVRTSVSIDSLTGAAKDGALFTSEAIPRGTVFSGTVRVAERLDGICLSKIWRALEDSKDYYESLGIGGMVTRGYGRMKMNRWFKKGAKDDESSKQNVGNAQ